MTGYTRALAGDLPPEVGVVEGGGVDPLLRKLRHVGPLYREDLVPPPAGDATWGLLRELVEAEERRAAWWRRPVPDAALEAWERLVCPQCARLRCSPAHVALLPFHDGGRDG